MAATLRIGLLSDLHFDHEATEQRSWIGTYDPVGLPDRIREAFAWFRSEEVALAVVAGDIVETPDIGALEAIFDLLSSTELPVAMVCGNHDVQREAWTREHARSRGVRLLDESPIIDPVMISGLTAGASARGGGKFAAAEATSSLGPGDVGRIVVSHFPLVSEAERLADAGLPYPGNLVNRRELLGELRAAAGPVIVLSGHIHARTATAVDNVLQLCCGALIEPPYDAAILTVSESLCDVRRVVRRLAPQVSCEPVFAADVERWTWNGEIWQLA